MARSVIVTTPGSTGQANDVLVFERVTKVERPEGERLQLFHQGETGQELLAEFTANGWLSWRWAPETRRVADSRPPLGAVLIEGEPIKPYKPPE